MNHHARLDAAPIPFIDVAAQRQRLGDRIDAAVARVLGCDVDEGNRGRDETSVLVHALELILTDVGKTRAGSPGRAEVRMGALHAHCG